MKVCLFKLDIEVSFDDYGFAGDTSKDINSSKVSLVNIKGEKFCEEKYKQLNLLSCK